MGLFGWISIDNQNKVNSNIIQIILIQYSFQLNSIELDIQLYVFQLTIKINSYYTYIQHTNTQNNTIQKKFSLLFFNWERLIIFTLGFDDVVSRVMRILPTFMLLHTERSASSMHSPLRTMLTAQHIFVIEVPWNSCPVGVSTVMLSEGRRLIASCTSIRMILSLTM